MTNDTDIYSDHGPRCKPSHLDRLNTILDKLDVEDDDTVRSELIDEAIGLADDDIECASAWVAYR